MSDYTWLVPTDNTEEQSLLSSEEPRKSCQGDLLLKFLSKSHAHSNGLQLGGLRPVPKDVGKTVLGRRLALLGDVGQRALVHGVHTLERSRAEALKACALIALHLSAAEGEGRSSGSQSLEFGDMWRQGRRNFHFPRMPVRRLDLLVATDFL